VEELTKEEWEKAYLEFLKKESRKQENFRSTPINEHGVLPVNV
jgi:hypothetical protein